MYSSSPSTVTVGVARVVGWLVEAIAVVAGLVGAIAVVVVGRVDGRREVVAAQRHRAAIAAQPARTASVFPVAGRGTIFAPFLLPIVTWTSRKFKGGCSSLELPPAYP
jgi:hypothetical protein